MTERKILVVDDEPRGVELMERVLRPLGQVLQATSVIEARRIIDHVELDVIVTDQRMPGASGVDLLSEIADKNETVGRILITGYADIDATIDAINRGRIHAYLSKPCPPSQLRLTVESVLDRIKLGRENAQLVHTLVERNRKLVHATRLLRDSQRAAEVAHQAKSAFLANVSDELRTPLTAILAYAQMLRHSPPSETERKQLLDSILFSGGHLLSVINDILEVARAEAGKLEVAFEEFPLVELFDEIRSSTRQQTQETGLELSLEIDAGVETIVSDPLRVRQILTNLVENALRYTATGSVRVVARACPADASRIALEVSDTGCGIARDAIPRALEPFGRIDNEAGPPAGMGLGLTICQRIVELLQGHLGIASEPGRGTVVTVTLPREPRRTPGGAALRETADAATRGCLPGIRVLIADDNVVSQRILATLLHQAGAEIEVAGDGAAALAQLCQSVEQGEPFDVILVDAELTIEGRLAASALREQGYKGGLIALSNEPIQEPSLFDGVLPHRADSLELVDAVTRCLPPADPAV